MTYSQEEFESEFGKENEYTKHIPAYLREYSKFIKLLLYFSNYINKSKVYIETITSLLNISNAVGDVLDKISQRLGIVIPKPLNSDGTVNIDLYEQQLKIAILGNGLKRTSKADRNSFNKLTTIFDSITRCDVVDFSTNSSSATPMLLQIDVVGKSDIWTKEMLEKYVFPNITGVRMVVNYILSNNVYFGFDKHDVINIIGTVTQITENVTQSILNAKALELGYAGSSLVLGTTITDASGHNWVFINSTTGWENKEDIAEGTTVIDPAVGYAVKGWDSGEWLDTTVIK